MAPANSRPACSASRFEEFVLTHKFVWDNKLRVGRCILYDRLAIQHGRRARPAALIPDAVSTFQQGEIGGHGPETPALDTAQSISIHHNASSAPSPRLAFLQHITLEGCSSQASPPTLIRSIAEDSSLLLNPSTSASPPVTSPLPPPPSSSSFSPPIISTPTLTSHPLFPPPSSSTSATFSIPTSSPQSPTPESNPLFTTEYFDVTKSAGKGYGAFATRDIEAGTIIISEKPLFKAKLVEIYEEYAKLTAEERREYNKLYGWQKLDDRPLITRFMTNRFEIDSTTGGIFLQSSRFNHACSQYKSCTYRYNQSIDRLEVTAHRSIQKGEEITICYTNRPNTLYGNYGFNCDCQGCPTPAEQEKQKKKNNIREDNDEPWLKPGARSFRDGIVLTEHYYTAFGRGR